MATIKVVEISMDHAKAIRRDPEAFVDSILGSPPSNNPIVTGWGRIAFTSHAREWPGTAWDSFIDGLRRPRH